MKTTSVVVIISLFLFSACEQKTKSLDPEEAATIAAEKRKSQLGKYFEIVFNQYGATATLDTAQFKMTYLYQEVLKKNNRVLVNDFKITDIEQRDSVYFVSIRKREYRKTKFFEFSCKQHEIEKICPDFKTSQKITTSIDDRILILKINSVQQLTRPEHTNNPQADPKNIFLFKGEFIDTYLKPL